MPAASQSLVKHTAESRLYYLEFGPFGGPQSARDVVWGVALGAIAAGEALVPALIPLLLLLSLVSSLPAATVTVARSDGNASDLSVGAAFVQTPTRLGLRVSGGTAGLGYTITCAVPTSQGNTVVVQGVLNVVSVLP